MRSNFVMISAVGTTMMCSLKIGVPSILKGFETSCADVPISINQHCLNILGHVIQRLDMQYMVLPNTK